MFQRLRQLVDQQILELSKPNNDYSEGWQYRQAHYNGQLEALMTIRKLIGEIN